MHLTSPRRAIFYCAISQCRGLVHRNSSILYEASPGRNCLHNISMSLGFVRQSGDGLGGEGVIYEPVNKIYDSVVVWLHGLGDTAEGWAGAMPALNLVNTKFILPTAPIRPITLNGGFRMNGWSDIFSLSSNALEDKSGLEQSCERIKAILDQEEKEGIKPEKMVVAGFSQGGALSMHFTMRSSKKLAGCVALSAWLPLNKEYPNALGQGAKEGIPVLQCHGDEDTVVSHMFGYESSELLKGMGVKATFETYRGMGHSACPEELEKVSEFLRTVLE